MIFQEGDKITFLRLITSRRCLKHYYKFISAALFSNDFKLHLRDSNYLILFNFISFFVLQIGKNEKISIRSVFGITISVNP